VDDPKELRRDLEPRGITSWICGPLTARGALLGPSRFVSAGSGRTFEEDDLTLAEDLAHRAAQAIDNARLYETQRAWLAPCKRECFHPNSRRSPGSQLAARYRPQREQRWAAISTTTSSSGRAGGAIVVGEVCSKGVQAAALTGLVRHTIRALAPPEEPSSVLLGVNDTILRQKSDEFRTLASAEVENREGQTRVRVCVAGHPLPSTYEPKGRVSGSGAPARLGLFPDPALGEARCCSNPGIPGPLHRRADRGAGPGVVREPRDWQAVESATHQPSLTRWRHGWRRRVPPARETTWRCLVLRCSG
jgi:hypothetical protein